MRIIITGIMLLVASKGCIASLLGALVTICKGQWLYAGLCAGTLLSCFFLGMAAINRLMEEEDPENEDIV